MITVDVSQGQTKSQDSISREIRDHVTPVGGEKQDSVAHGDVRLGGKYSIQNVTVVCSDGCDLTHGLNRAEIDWCGISVDRLIWGYHVSCLVAIVNRDRTIGRCMLMEGSGIYASTWGLEDRPVIPCDVIPVFVWMTEKFKAILNKVMLVDKATVDSHGLQWGEDNTPVWGIHMHDPRVIEYMGAPESARLLGRTPEYWLEHMGRERTIQAALRLHHDTSLIMTNIQVMSQLATSFSRAASEVMRTVHDREPFPTDAVDLVTPGRRVRRAAHYMAAMGLWRPTSAPVFPGPVSASSCNSCMVCADCFPDGGK